MSALCSEGDLSSPIREGRAFLSKAVAGKSCLNAWRCHEVSLARYAALAVNTEPWVVRLRAQTPALTLKGSSRLGT